MDFLNNIPIWLAYVIAPAFILVIASITIFRSESPLFMVAISIAMGLCCAAVLHGYILIKKKLMKDKSERVARALLPLDSRQAPSLLLICDARLCPLDAPLQSR